MLREKKKVLTFLNTGTRQDRTRVVSQDPHTLSEVIPSSDGSRTLYSLGRDAVYQKCLPPLLILQKKKKKNPKNVML